MNEEKQSEWISINDRLPDDVSVQGVVAVLVDGEHSRIGEYADNYGRFVYHGGPIIGKVTHWMPLPAAPEQGE